MNTCVAAEAECENWFKQTEVITTVSLFECSSCVKCGCTCWLFVQDNPERQRLLPLPPHGGHSERDDAGVWRKHTQWYVYEPRRQVLLLRLPGLQSGSVTHTHTHNHTLTHPFTADMFTCQSRWSTDGPNNGCIPCSWASSKALALCTPTNLTYWDTELNGVIVHLIVHTYVFPNLAIWDVSD